MTTDFIQTVVFPSLRDTVLGWYPFLINRQKILPNHTVQLTLLVTAKPNTYTTGGGQSRPLSLLIVAKPYHLLYNGAGQTIQLTLLVAAKLYHLHY
jgi:hypothetical protein